MVNEVPSFDKEENVCNNDCLSYLTRLFRCNAKAMEFFSSFFFFLYIHIKLNKAEIQPDQMDPSPLSVIQ